MALVRVGAEWPKGDYNGHSGIVLTNGNLLSFWVETAKDGLQSLVGQAYTPSGAVHGAKFVLKTAETASYLSFPEVSVAALANSRFAVAWLNQNERLEIGIFNSNGSMFKAPIQIGPKGVYSSSLATLADGGFVLNYRDGGNTSVTFNANGDLGTTSSIDTDHDGKVVGLRGGGYVTVVDSTYSSVPGTQLNVYVRRADGGLKEVHIKSWPDDEELETQVVGLANGNFVVAWSALHSDIIEAQVVSPTGTLIGEELALYQRADARIGSIALEALFDGGFALAFSQADSGRDIYLSTYSASGSVINAPMLVDQYDDGEQDYPSLQVLRDGSILVGWADVYGGYRNHYQAFSTGYVVPAGTDPLSTFGLTFNGMNSKDKLVGGAGNDKFYGGYGNDTLTGLGGADIFVFNAKLGSAKTDKKVNFETITDFKPSEDKIWLDNAIFKKLGKAGSEAAPAALSKKFFKAGTKAGDKNDYLVYNKKTGVLSYDVDGSGAKEAIEIAKLPKKLKLSHLDFEII